MLRDAGTRPAARFRESLCRQRLNVAPEQLGQQLLLALGPGEDADSER